MDSIIYILVFTFIFLPVIFCVLFIIFLTKSIQRGKRIKELEKEIYDLKSGNKNQAAPNTYTSNAVPQQPYIPQQNMMPGYPGQPYIQLPEIQPQGYMPAQGTSSAPVQAYAPQAAASSSQPVVPQQAIVSAQSVAHQTAPFAPVQTYAPQTANQPQSNNDIPGQAPTPSWAKKPGEINNVTAYQQPVLEEKKPREKFFSSINITFGIGVLLLTIVGATFMTGSWPWMTEGVRAVCLVMIVFIVYGMSFFAGKILKLKQTEFALYTLASLLGPIVIVGMGTFNLLGSAFSFSGGTGWLVATVAALVLTATSVGGRFLFKEKTQANIYQGTFYIALTWLVVFLCGQIGHAGSGVTEWGMICLGLATLALVFRIAAATNILEGEVFFKVYSEIITYITAGLILFSSFLSDAAILGASIVEFVAFVIFAKFSSDRKWIRYLLPFVGMMIAGSWIVFADATEDTVLITSITIAVFVILYATLKILKLSTLLSDLLFTISLGTMPTFIAIEKVPVMGVVSCFFAVVLLVFQMLIEPALAESDLIPEGILRKENPVPLQVAFSLLATVFYYLGVVMLYLTIKEFPLQGHLYFTLTALIPACAALAVRFFRKDDIRIRASGILLSIGSVIAAFVSCFSITTKNNPDTGFYSHVNVCSWILTLALIVLALFIMVKPLKEKVLSVGVMFWTSVCLNAFAIGVFMTIGYHDEAYWEINKAHLPEAVLAYKIAALVFLALNMAATGAAALLKKKGKDLVSSYAAGMKFFFVGFAVFWFIITGTLFDVAWQMLIIAVIFAVLLILFDSGFFSIIPVLVAECAMVYEFVNLDNADLSNILCIVSAVVFAVLGRLIYRRNVFSAKAVDYLSLTSFLFLFGLNGADYVAMMVFLTLSLLVMNLAGRIKIPVKVIVSVFASLVCLAVVAQPFFEYPDVIDLEVNIIIMLGTLFMICRVIKPAPYDVMKYFWFTGVSLSLIAEGVSAAVTGEVLDLIIVGTASFGIFIYAFIRRNRLWFILGIVSMISVAVYLSIAFWSSLVWLIYLFVAGTILVVMASLNEWGKRHNKDGKKKRFFEEWTW